MSKNNLPSSSEDQNLKNQNLDNQNSEENIVVITDEEGNNHNCVILDLVEFKNKNYVSLVPADSLDDSDSEIADLFIMEIESDGDSEYLKSIEDQENYEEICQMMIDRLSEDFDVEY